MASGADGIIVGRSGAGPLVLPLGLANRHGLVAGATGTGKTVTLQVLAEGFSRAGVPVFLADIKGDLAGLSRPGASSPRLAERCQALAMELPPFGPSPVVFWDLFGVQGHPVRATVSEMGPLLLARMLDLSDAQEGVLSIAFQLADDEGLLLLDFNDLQALLAHVAERAKELNNRYGLVSPQSVGAVQRKLLELRRQGGDGFFGEPALALADLVRTTWDGRGVVNVLAADRLMQTPKLYAAFLLWLLSELFEEMPEVGDPDKPRLVFFFDEAHLLFDDAPKALVDRIETVVRLIRSKGVGVYFVTQSPLDLPDRVLGQLGHRVQHALRAFTPRDRKAVIAAAATFRPNPALDVEAAITELGVGEALISTLGPKGVPGMVERSLVPPPASRIGPVSDEERRQTVGSSPVGARYDTPVDRDSAYEVLGRRATASSDSGSAVAPPPTRRPAPQPRASSRQGAGEAFGKAVLRSIGSSLGREVGRQLLRGLLGSLTRR